MHETAYETKQAWSEVLGKNRQNRQQTIFILTTKTIRFHIQRILSTLPPS
ncbi:MULTISPECIES: hypothetical protein [unclassified Agarivorans]